MFDSVAVIAISQLIQIAARDRDRVAENAFSSEIVDSWRADSLNIGVMINDTKAHPHRHCRCGQVSYASYIRRHRPGAGDNEIINQQKTKTYGPMTASQGFTPATLFQFCVSTAARRELVSSKSAYVLFVILQSLSCTKTFDSRLSQWMQARRQTKRLNGSTSHELESFVSMLAMLRVLTS
jgi:hypothetical protein